MINPSTPNTLEYTLSLIIIIFYCREHEVRLYTATNNVRVSSCKTHKEISSLLYGLRAMMSLSALLPVAISTMRGIRKNRIGTAKRNKNDAFKTVLLETTMFN